MKSEQAVQDEIKKLHKDFETFAQRLRNGDEVYRGAANTAAARIEALKWVLS